MEKIMDLETAKRILKENNYLVEARPRPYRTTRYERDFKYIRPHSGWTNDDEVQSARQDLEDKRTLFYNAGDVKDKTGRKRAILEHVFERLSAEKGTIINSFEVIYNDDRIIVGPLFAYGRRNDTFDTFIGTDVSDIFPEYKTRNSVPTFGYTGDSYDSYIINVFELHLDDIDLSDSLETTIEKAYDVIADLSSELSRKEIITRLEDLKNRFSLLVRAFGKYNAQSYYEDFKGYTTEQIKQELAKDY